MNGHNLTRVEENIAEGRAHLSEEKRKEKSWSVSRRGHERNSIRSNNPVPVPAKQPGQHSPQRTSIPSDFVDDPHTFLTRTNFNMTHRNRILIKPMCAAQFPPLALPTPNTCPNLRRSHTSAPKASPHQRLNLLCGSRC